MFKKCLLIYTSKLSLVTVEHGSRHFDRTKEDCSLTSVLDYQRITFTQDIIKLYVLRGAKVRGKEIAITEWANISETQYMNKRRQGNLS